ncbi:MAG: ABC transporter permease subunit [Thermoleophilia bacterium]|nr:ABC transporter permease subunit [Thermoleophilia bacterium]
MIELTVARLTARVLLGRRRILFFFVFPALVVGLAALVRVLSDQPVAGTASVVGTFGFVTLLPVLCVVAGTGVIGPEIEDGSIIYLLAKPVRRSSIVAAKLVVAVLTCLCFGTGSILAAGLVGASSLDGAPITFAMASVLAIVAYCSVFLLLAVATRHAVVIGIGYALVWESLIGSFLPGVRNLSIQQWSLSLTDQLLGRSARFGDLVSPSIGAGTAAVLVLLVTVAATWLSTQRLRSLRMTDAG